MTAAELAETYQKWERGTRKRATRNVPCPLTPHEVADAKRYLARQAKHRAFTLNEQERDTERRKISGTKAALIMGRSVQPR